jgi:hypothetical protein
MHLPARSISRSAKQLLDQKPFAARVLAAFDQACDLVTPQGDILALVSPPVGDGPLNVVVEAEPGDLASAEPGTPARLDGLTIEIGRLRIALDAAKIWEPHPEWSALRARREAVEARLPALRAIALHHAPAGSLLTTPIVGAPPDATWPAGVAQLQDTAERLAGLGGGLTPAGDDFLAGLMLWAWLAHPGPEQLGHTLAEAAAPRTTTLSAAFLRAAARGECDAAWHRLLVALSAGRESDLAPAIRAVLAHGATSGADMLAGFMWLAP